MNGGIMRHALVTLALAITTIFVRPAAAQSLPDGIVAIAVGAVVLTGGGTATVLGGNIYCVAAGEKCPRWGWAGVVVGGAWTFAGGAYAIREGGPEYLAIGAAGLALTILGGIVAYQGRTESERLEYRHRIWGTLTPIVIESTQSSTTGLAIVGGW